MTANRDINDALTVLRSGGVIVYPTDTVWGIGCDAENSEAVRRIYEIKHRLDSKALITLVADKEMLGRYTDADIASLLTLLSQSERPTTIIYPSAKNLAPELIAEDGSVGIRISTEAVSGNLCRLFGKALVSTSANVSGEPTPRRFAEISAEILAKADYVMKARRDENGHSLPSRIIRLKTDGEIEVLRQ